MRLCARFGVVFFCFLTVHFTEILLLRPLHVGRVRGARQGSWGSAAIITLSAVKLPSRLL